MAPMSCLPACPEFGIMELDEDFVSQLIQQAELSNSNNKPASQNSYNELSHLCGELGNLELEFLTSSAAPAPAPYGFCNEMHMYNQHSISTPNLAAYSPSLDLSYFSPPSNYTTQQNKFSSPLSEYAIAHDPFRSPIEDQVLEQSPPHPNNPLVRARANSAPLELMPAPPPLPVKSIELPGPSNLFSPPTSQVNLQTSRHHSSDHVNNSASAASLIPSSPESPRSFTESRAPMVDSHKSKRRSSTPSTHSSPSNDSLAVCRRGSQTGLQRRLRRRRAQLTLPFGCFLCHKSYQELRSLQHHCRTDHDVKITKAMYKLFESKAKAADEE